MIPENKQDAIKKALESAFGVSAYEDIKKLTTGLSNALVYRIKLQGKSYILKIARTDALSDPALYYYDCMKSAAEVGIAPRIWYLDINDGISITDFVELSPFPIAKARTELADLLSRLHSLPPFTKTIHSLDTVNRFVRRFKELKILPEVTTDKLFSSLERIIAAYPGNNSDLVPCHNDLKPENILFDGKKAWLSDWEAAFTNDRYSDLSIVANFLVANETDEREFLNTYFGRNATEYEHARFYLMQQIMHFSYFTVFMVIVAARSKQIDLKYITQHDFRDFHDQMWKGKIDLASDQVNWSMHMCIWNFCAKIWGLRDLRMLFNWLRDKPQQETSF
jgi:Ser/Thr protein kinase RdoA (MazF antagonist)